MTGERWARWRPRLWRWGAYALFFAGIGAAVYWVKFAPVPVAGHRVERGEIVVEVLGTGTLEARVKSTISPKISGRILELYVDQGDRVTAGKLLFKLDDADLKQQVEIAHAALAAAQAAIARLTADRAQAEAVQTQASRNRARITSLLAKKVVGQEEFDKATEAASVAEAGVAKAEAALLEGNKQLIAAEKTLAYHRARLDDTQIYAPFDGLIVRRQRDPGDIVVPGSPTLTLISTDEIWITAWVDETEMARVREKQPARIVFRSEPERSYAGKVSRVGREADRETREYVVDVGLLALPEQWAVGQRAEVFIETARKQSALLLPAPCVVWHDRTPGAIVDAEGRGEWRAVKLGLRGRETVEVVEGLEPGDTVVLPLGAKGGPLEGRRLQVSVP